jgi:UDP-N-acetylmuramyl-tripeptide synthetase
MIAAADFPRTKRLALLDRLAQLGVPLHDVTADSRAVKLGTIFVAYPGTIQDGRAFIAEAIARGAAAVLWEKRGFQWDERWEVPNLGIEGLREQVSEIAGHLYGNPSDSLCMIGVTGTNGKTSVSQWIASACETLGRHSAVLGTLGNGLVGERVEAKNTTPDAIVLQRLLAEYARRGAKVAAMEVSSHGLDQGRVTGIKYDVAVFTNLTRDHIDYHRTMDAYAEAKYRLFAAKGLKRAVVNVDDDWGARFAPRLVASGLDVITFGQQTPARLAASNVALSEAGVRFDLFSEWGEGTVSAPMLGRFNVSNLLAVIGALLATGIAFDDVLRAVAKLEPVPGRLERLGGGERPLVVIDYAHTPDALEKALVALRPAVAKGGELVCVFGCGGDRDPGKRSEMGRIAGERADRIVVTNDNPRREDPEKIAAAIVVGIRSAGSRDF